MTGVSSASCGAGLALVLAAPILAVLGGCARPGSPGGGPVPSDPLTVVSTEPADGSTVTPFDAPVRVRFQRTVSERPTQGSIGEAVLVSPEAGRVSVRLRDEVLEISVEGGFEPGIIYRVTVLPRLRDRYQNGMRSAFDLFFSTGPLFEPTLLAGVVLDRATMRPLGGVRVDATPASGGSALTTEADSTGVFAFPHLASGEWSLSIYEDRNRNRTPDGTERQASRSVTLAFADTLILTDLAVLVPDDTPAVLQAVAVVDSLTLRLPFDDALDAAAPLTGVTATIVAEGAAGPAPAVAELLHRAEWEARTPPPPGGGVASGRVGGGGPGSPAREILVLLADPLTRGTTYRVNVTGVVNLNGVSGGGGERAVTLPAPPG